MIYPTIPNVIAQIAISGVTQDGHTSALETVVVADMIELGLCKESINVVVSRAVELGIVLRKDEHLWIAQ